MSPADQNGPPDGYVTLAEACKRLNVSDRTLRRRIERGEIEAEHIPRPQGTVLYVKLPADAAEQAARDAAPDGAPSADQTGRASGPDIARALLERNTAQADRIAVLERENGRLESEATQAKEAARIERERADALRERAGRAEAERDMLAEQLERARDDLAWQQLPWWRKLGGRPPA